VIAINLADLSRFPQPITQALIGPHVERLSLINAEPTKLDGSAIPLACDDLTACCIIDVLRRKDRQLGQYDTRAYRRGPRGGWDKLTGTTPLTVLKPDGSIAERRNAR
jgi:hypothetical protein